jgi:hypothetical protein
MSYRDFFLGFFVSMISLIVALSVAIPISEIGRSEGGLPPASENLKSYYDEEIAALRNYHEEFLKELDREVREAPFPKMRDLLTSRYFAASFLLFGVITVGLGFRYLRRSYKGQILGYFSFFMLMIFLGGIFYSN